MVLCNRCAAEKNLGLSVKTHSCDPDPVQQSPKSKSTEPVVASQPPPPPEPQELPKSQGYSRLIVKSQLPFPAQPSAPPQSQPETQPQSVASKDSPRIQEEPKLKPRDAMSSRMSIPPQLQQQLRLLIRANHILHNHSLVDAFGHISVRHPLNREQYIIAAYDPGAPALISSAQDFISYWVKDSTPVDPGAPQGYSERYIHGEILRKFPKAKCVVHSHSEDVIPFTLGKDGGIPVKPVFHMAGFMGASPCPVFKMDSLHGTSRAPSESDMLIKNAILGAALASYLSDEHPVVLQHKHGFTTFGASIEEAVYRAIYTQKNCVLLQRALANVGGESELVDYLTSKEAEDCAVMNKKTLDKSFRLWVREVQVNPLYESEEGEPEKGRVAGMKM